MKTCESCVYCDKITNVHNWTCHRYPPQWPTVYANNWCGEFKPDEMINDQALADAKEKIRQIDQNLVENGLETEKELKAELSTGLLRDSEPEIESEPDNQGLVKDKVSEILDGVFNTLKSFGKKDK